MQSVWVLAGVGLMFAASGWSAVDARFEPFMITSDVFRNMGMADCELVEDFARQILPLLVTRDLKLDVSCGPARQRGGRFLVRGEILRSLPPR
jgi:hypothetical protein